MSTKSARLLASRCRHAPGKNAHSGRSIVRLQAHIEVEPTLLPVLNAWASRGQQRPVVSHLVDPKVQAGERLAVLSDAVS
jgi:hypothetical protein